MPSMSPPPIASGCGTQAPPLKIKPSPSASSPPPAISPSTPTSFTSKEWIVPPRPKPGRKPATDTPPTKRKAQNRAAQRAFRERRAARVGELEEQLQQVEEQDCREIHSLRGNIEALQKDLRNCLEKCRDLERMVEFERTEKEKLALKLQKMSDAGSSEAVPIPRRQPTDCQTELRLDAPQVQSTTDTAPIGCGKCSLDSSCQCLEEVINATIEDPGIPDDHSLKPSGSTSSSSTQQRQIKAEPTDENELEIDFTTYNTNKPQDVQDDDVIMSSPDTSTPVTDPCGFCSDGTPCVCAQMAAEEQQSVAGKVDLPSSSAIVNTGTSSESRLSFFPPRPLRQQTSQQFTPPPSDTDVSNPCANGPGTCAQCLSDPASTLFCKSLAASRTQSSGSSTNTTCCGNRANCNSINRNRNYAPNAPSPLRLSCADTYTTLSRHEGYQQASKDLSSWMPRLAAESSTTDGRHPMEIEAATVMSLLGEFDRRFTARK